ncbi:ataxin-7 isoform X1 [Crotalus tigris]|uniref:ataxin-7 isoform X1 n=1 Tax=Crotalus tigris TaxID=88082 RepID=UPI00192F8A20|nr:ataxin-7 isoform X1 [Crotalus tigris]XP_039215797.1 ataxin-7 isoform X1 [Crotalus tigris]XP_039215799.1 ataxin-7 isoform X1 [Crotalus tigris]XP_039215800.1 ataxin-7 isoform X1 [Crotalus tigris]
MSARAVADVRGEQRRAAVAAASRQQRRPRHGGGSGESGLGPATTIPASTATATSAAMATVGERRSLPSPEAMLGQPWSHWVDAAKLHGNDGAALEENFKEYGKNREAMRLCREGIQYTCQRSQDMPIFGLCPAHDDFYLVMCNHCNQVVKPQAFQSHYERRHSSSSKPPLTPPSSSVFSLYSSLSSKSKGSSGGGSNRSSSGGGAGASSSSSSKLLKSPKDKLPIGGNNRPMHLIHSKGLHDKIMTPSVKMEKIHPKLDGALLKPAIGPTCSTTVSSSIKTGLNPSIPKPPLPSPGQIVNGKSLLSVPPYTEKKQDESTNNRKFLHKRLSEREFDPDIYCGVIDTETKKPCTRSLTCKTHSLTQRRAVQGRRKRFDLLLAEHKSKTREKELLRHLDHHQQMPLLREPHPSPSRTSQELHQNSHGVIPTESKPLVPNKPKPHTPSLPRPPGCPGQHSGNAPSESPSLHESPHAPLPAAEPTSRLSSDEGECDEKEEPVEKLDCLYSDHHPQAAAFCTFGSRQIGRGYYVFDKRWNHIRCALNVMVDKHLNSQMWKKIPPATSNSASIRAPHRTSAMAASQYGVSTTSSTLPTTAVSPPVLVSPSCLSLSGKSVPSHGTTLNANPASFGATEPACSMQSRQGSTSLSTPPVLSSIPSPLSSKPQKFKSSKSFKPKEISASSANYNSNSSSSNSGSGSSGKKRKNSSVLPAASSHSTESFRKNCVVNSGNSGASFHSPVMSSSHSVGLNCMTSKANSLSLKHDQSGRGPPTGSPAESIKRMSVMVNSGDSTLSLGPFIHQSSELTVNSHSGFSHSHPSLDKLIGKKRKCAPGSSSLSSSSSSSKASKIAKLPPVNNIHTKHTGAIPGTQGLMNNSILHQPKARP